MIPRIARPRKSLIPWGAEWHGEILRVVGLVAIQKSRIAMAAVESLTQLLLFQPPSIVRIAPL